MDQEQEVKEIKEPLKKSHLFGLISLGILLVGFAILGYMGISGWRAYAGGNLASFNITLMLKLLNVAVVVSALAFLLSVVTLFLRRQKKAIAIISLILSLLLFASVGGVRYVYYTAFESKTFDSEFSQITEEELYIIPDLHTKEIEFESIPEETKSREEVEEILELYEVDWPYLEETDVPERVYPYMYSQAQESPCYLKPGAEQIENFILYGIDKNGLSDVIMIVSMDRVHHKIKLISIQRDSYVRVPEWGGYTKINHAYGLNKETSAIATLNLNFKLNIKDYFTLHIYQVETLIDALGGVDVYLDAAEVDYMYGYGYSGLVVGMNHLNGAQAVTYSRMRSSGKNDNEVRRTGRQREVLNYLYNSAKSAPISYYPTLVDTFTDLTKTSVSGDRILNMMIEAVGEGYTLENYALINYVKCWGGQFGKGGHWYFVYDLDAAGDTLYRLIYEDLYISGYPNNELNPDAGY